MCPDITGDRIEGIRGSAYGPLSKNSKFECKGKEKYYTKREAEQEIYRVMRESYGGVVGLRAYKCKHCDHYHLTSNLK